MIITDHKGYELLSVGAKVPTDTFPAVCQLFSESDYGQMGRESPVNSEGI